MQIRNLELLKLRFGENNLHFCEVMIKDIADSKRINTHIVSQIKRSRVSEDGEPPTANNYVQDLSLSMCRVWRDRNLMLSSYLMFSGQLSGRKSSSFLISFRGCIIIISI